MRIEAALERVYLNGLIWSPGEIFICDMIVIHGVRTRPQITALWSHSVWFTPFFVAARLPSSLPCCALSKGLHGGAPGCPVPGRLLLADCKILRNANFYFHFPTWSKVEKKKKRCRAFE